jgi:hypothetical protein
MAETSFMNSFYSTNKLSKVVPCSILRKRTCFFDKIKKISSLEKLQTKEVLFTGFSWRFNLNRIFMHSISFNNIGMINALKDIGFLY